MSACACVCVHVINAMAVRIWRNMTLCMRPVCVTVETVCFIKWLSTDYSFENGMQSHKHIMLIIFFADIILSCLLKWFACCFLHFYRYICTWYRNTALSACCDIPSRTDIVFKMASLQNGWKMILMFPLCLTVAFFQGTFSTSHSTEGNTVCCPLPQKIPCQCLQCLYEVVRQQKSWKCLDGFEIWKKSLTNSS